MKKTFRAVTIITLTAAAMSLLSACSEAKSEEKVVEEIISIPVLAEPVVIGSINAAYGTTASLEAAEEAAIAARVSGIVTEVFVEEGDYVEAGQALAQLDVDKLTLEYNRAAAKLNQAKNDLNRNKKMFEKSLVSSEIYDRVNFEYQAQKAATDLAKLNLDYATIRSSISGIVAIRHIKAGNLLKQNEAAFQITDLSEIHAIIHIPESEKADLQIGQPAYVYVQASPTPFVGQIQRISPVIDKDSGTIRVTVSLKDESAVLRPGMFSKVSIVYDTHQNAILVPKDSVLSEDAEQSVYVIEDGIAYKRLVTTGFINSESIEIITGVVANDLVITTGQRNLKNESHVEIIGGVIADVVEDETAEDVSKTVAEL